MLGDALRSNSVNCSLAEGRKEPGMRCSLSSCLKCRIWRKIPGQVLDQMNWVVLPLGLRCRTFPSLFCLQLCVIAGWEWAWTLQETETSLFADGEEFLTQFGLAYCRRIFYPKRRECSGVGAATWDSQGSTLPSWQQSAFLRAVPNGCTPWLRRNLFIFSGSSELSKRKVTVDAACPHVPLTWKSKSYTFMSSQDVICWLS